MQDSVLPRGVGLRKPHISLFSQTQNSELRRSRTLLPPYSFLLSPQKNQNYDAVAYLLTSVGWRFINKMNGGVNKVEKRVDKWGIGFILRIIEGEFNLVYQWVIFRL